MARTQSSSAIEHQATKVRHSVKAKNSISTSRSHRRLLMLFHQSIGQERTALLTYQGYLRFLEKRISILQRTLQRWLQQRPLLLLATPQRLRVLLLFRLSTLTKGARSVGLSRFDMAMDPRHTILPQAESRPVMVLAQAAHTMLQTGPEQSPRSSCVLLLWRMRLLPRFLSTLSMSCSLLTWTKSSSVSRFSHLCPTPRSF